MISKEMSVLEIVEKYPETEPVFSKYDSIIGKCLLCHCLFDTVYHLTNKYNISLKTLLDEINKAIEENQSIN